MLGGLLNDLNSKSRFDMKRIAVTWKGLCCTVGLGILYALAGYASTRSSVLTDSGVIDSSGSGISTGWWYVVLLSPLIGAGYLAWFVTFLLPNQPARVSFRYLVGHALLYGLASFAFACLDSQVAGKSGMIVFLVPGVVAVTFVIAALMLLVWERVWGVPV